uniref:NADH-ubiquinone oxidoreductase chain 4 n=1 Tax=Paroedura picta TaxID=143630 RepID=A0A0U2KM74_9SAUR|nr:NADH dehydrogenase subunit 4 [Paroedura picta]ALF04028.1 NADH dehydrogenase subunit 4 [Paroedura picta]
MLKLLGMTMMLVPTALLTPTKFLVLLFTLNSMTMTLFTMTWLYHPLKLTPQMVAEHLLADTISIPLVALSSWILPLMIIASQHTLTTEPAPRTRMLLSTCALLQLTLILTFLMADLMMFYIMFEATLLPTLILITRWGGQAERLTAGTYFLFYTLVGSIPLLVAILKLYATNHHTSTLILTLLQPHMHSPMLWLACMMALLVKMPLYGLHLWLPKAHVEAPIAGSMILAAVLLKLGGYGIIRLTTTLTPTTQAMYYPLIALALWGMVMACLTCLRHTDLKAIIAYSSVSHMGLVISATMINTPWSIGGAMVLMVAHGLTSSMLFCLANTNYERTHTRTLTLTRGSQLMLPLMAMWWLSACLANMALPPTINLLSELMVISSLFNWASTTIFLTAPTTLITATYSLYIFITLQRNKTTMNTPTKPITTREHLLMALHMLPLISLTLHPNLMF